MTGHWGQLICVTMRWGHRSQIHSDRRGSPVPSPWHCEKKALRLGNWAVGVAG